MNICKVIIFEFRLMLTSEIFEMHTQVLFFLSLLLSLSRTYRACLVMILIDAVVRVTSNGDVFAPSRLDICAIAMTLKKATNDLRSIIHEQDARR